MQPNQEMPRGQSMQQNYPMQQGSPMQSNYSQQQNYQTQQNVQMQNPQSEYNNQMQFNQIPQNQQNQQNFQMNQNSQNQQFNQQMPQNPQSQPNSQMQFNQQMPQNQQNQQMQFNQQMGQNQQNPQMQFNQQMPQNSQNQQNPQMQFNQQMGQNQQNPQMQFNQQMPQNPQNQQNSQMQFNQQMPQNQQNCCQMQQNNASLSSSQSRPLPPPLPKNSNQNLYPSMKRVSSQRIPLRTSSSANGSNCSMSLQQSMQYSSMASMQSMGSSDSEEMQNIQPQQLPQPQEQPQQLQPQAQPQQQQQITSSSQNLSQVLAVVYNNITYKVDPELMCNASPKVKEMLLPFIQENRLNDAHLEIMGNKFTYRNFNNFLKLCQNLPTDVENSEMEEICEIAKLFGAEKIYNTGVTFIRQNLDPNFSVPDNKYDGSDGKKYLYVEDDQHVINHSSALQSNMGNDDDDDDGEDDDEDDNNEVKQNPSVPSSTDKNESGKSKIDTTKIGSVIYRVKVEKHALRCTVFHFYDDSNVLFTGKQKNENIFIGEGYDVHISSNQKNHVAHITQDDYLHNIIFLKDKNFKLKYVNSGKPNHYSINVTFPLNKDKMITWTPKQPKYDPIKDKYYLNFHGEHHHTPMKSKKNIVLQNDNGHPTFIVRKMDNEMYEIECLPLVDPLIAFVIGLSDIVGPYMDPCGDIVI